MHTVDGPADVEEEIAALFAALGHLKGQTCPSRLPDRLLPRRPAYHRRFIHERQMIVCPECGGLLSAAVRLGALPALSDGCCPGPFRVQRGAKAAKSGRRTALTQGCRPPTACLADEPAGAVDARIGGASRRAARLSRRFSEARRARDHRRRGDRQARRGADSSLSGARADR